MSIAGTLITIAAAALGYWVVRSVMQEPEGNLSAGSAPPEPQPQARKAPAPDTQRRTATNPRSATRPQAARAPSANATRPHPRAPDLAWYIQLDCPSGADRREIQEAVKRRIARARIDGDSAAIARILRAAAAGIRDPQRGERVVRVRPRAVGPRAS